MTAYAYGTVGAEEELTPASPVKTSAYTASPGDLVPCNITSGGFTVTLPDAPADQTRAAAVIIATNTGATNLLTVACQGSDVLNISGGSASMTLSVAGQSAIFQYDQAAAIWYVTAGYLPSAGIALLTGAAFTGEVTATEGIAGGVVTLTYSSSVAITASAGGHFRVTLTGNASMGISSPLKDGQKITLEVIQGTGGGYTLTWSDSFDFGAAGTPVLSTAAGKRDLIGFCWSSPLGQWMFAGISQGL